MEFEACKLICANEVSTTRLTELNESFLREAENDPGTQTTHAIDLDIEFHETILTLAGMPEACIDARHDYHKVLIWAPSIAEPGRPQETYVEQLAILDAIQQGDDISMYAASKMHLESAAFRDRAPDQSAKQQETIWTSSFRNPLLLRLLDKEELFLQLP